MPSFLTQLDVDQFPAVYRQFAERVGEVHWRQRVAQIDAAIKSNPYLGDHLRRENYIAYALERCRALIEANGGPSRLASSAREVYPAISFAAQALSMIDAATPGEAQRLVKRVQDTLKNPDAMRGYRLELGVATHFALRGHKLQWPEIVGIGTFDLLVLDLGLDGLEVECKSISANKGRSIHRHEALALHQLLVPELQALHERLNVGLAVVLTVPRRLPTGRQDLHALARSVLCQILAGRGTRLSDGTEIRVNEFDLAILGNVARDHSLARALIEQVTSTRNREGVLIGTDGRGAIAFVVQSALDDDFVPSAFATLKDAAKRQLSKERPGIVIAGLNGIDASQLQSLAEQDNDRRQPATALMAPIQEFLSAAHRNHVVGVGLFSRSDLREPRGGVVGSGGAAYYFPNRTSRLWHDDFSGLFDSKDASA